MLIIVDHKSDLIKCNGLEQVMECFRHIVTQIRSDDVDRYLKKVRFLARSTIDVVISLSSAQMAFGIIRYWKRIMTSNC